MLKISKRLIDVSGMSDIIQRRIPVLTLDSKKPGPRVWLAGCIHGDEPGGSAIIHDLFKEVRRCGLERGAIHALPLVNSMGFENVSRYITPDREDLNRCFPGNIKGTMGERIAHRLFEMIVATGPDLVIDLHNDWIQSVPYVLIDPASLFPSAEIRKKTIRYAAATGLLTVQETTTNPDVAKTLSGALVAEGICSFTVEAGGACGIVESSVESGKTSMLSVLARLGLIDSGFEIQPTETHRVLDYTSQPRCSSSGIVRFSVNPGDEIAAEQEVAKVYSAFGSVEETLKANRSGYVLGVSDHARAVPGSEIVAIAEFDSNPSSGQRKQTNLARKRYH